MQRDNTSIQLQLKLGEYCRNGVEVDLPLSRPENLPVYRRLVFNGVKDTLEQAFPITHEVLSIKQWDKMIYRFFSDHECHSPQLWKMPEEFYSFCEEYGFAKKYEMPWLNDLLLFEWLEIKVHTMPDKAITPFRTDGDILEDISVMNPHLWLQHLKYPVHLKSVQEASQKPGDYYVAIYRHPDSDAVHFFNLNRFLVQVMEYLSEECYSGKESLLRAANDMGIQDTDMVLRHGIAFLNDLRNANMIYGFIR